MLARCTYVAVVDAGDRSSAWRLRKREREQTQTQLRSVRARTSPLAPCRRLQVGDGKGTTRGGESSQLAASVSKRHASSAGGASDVLAEVLRCHHNRPVCPHAPPRWCRSRHRPFPRQSDGSAAAHASGSREWSLSTDTSSCGDAGGGTQLAMRTATPVARPAKRPKLSSGAQIGSH